MGEAGLMPDAFASGRDSDSNWQRQYLSVKADNFEADFLRVVGVHLASYGLG